jgi:hypothetical protein
MKKKIGDEKKEKKMQISAFRLMHEWWIIYAGFNQID